MQSDEGGVRSRPRGARGRHAERSNEWLLAQYRRTKDVRLRNLLVERFRPEVDDIARKLHHRLPRHVDTQDLAHAGIQGLIHAIERFDQRRGRSFTAFMLLRVRGSMLDELRAGDWLPRPQRVRMVRRNASIQRLRGELGREPNDDEVAVDMSMTTQAYQVTFGASSRTGNPGAGRGSDDGEDGFDHLCDPDQESPLEDLYRQEILARVLALLSPVELRMVKLHYFDGLKLNEVARKLKLSPARVCQIHGRVLARLKTRLTAESVAV
jgi:RNA polymerase sigma factor for flagellar operon FliA